MRSSFKSFVIISAAIVAAGCSSKPKAADTALSSDLSLAAQARQNAVLDSVTAAERMKSATLAANATAPAKPHTAAPVHRSTSSSGTRSSSSNSGSVATSSGHTEVVKHTNRDAAIGAAAGAIIGATTSGNKVKGGIIGAAAGGILGGVIGNNVDKKTVKVPE